MLCLDFVESRPTAILILGCFSCHSFMLLGEMGFGNHPVITRSPAYETRIGKSVTWPWTILIHSGMFLPIY